MCATDYETTIKPPDHFSPKKTCHVVMETGNIDS